MSSFSLPSFSSAFVYSPLLDARAVPFCERTRGPPHMYESRPGLSSKISSMTTPVERWMRDLSLSHRSKPASPPAPSARGLRDYDLSASSDDVGYVVASVRAAPEGGSGLASSCSAGCPIGVLGAEPAPA